MVMFLFLWILLNCIIKINGELSRSVLKDGFFCGLRFVTRYLLASERRVFITLVLLGLARVTVRWYFYYILIDYFVIV